MSPKRTRRAEPIQTHLMMTVDDLERLKTVAHHYERSMGPARHFVRWASGPEMRARFAFVSVESTWLERFIEAALAETEKQGGTAEITFTVRTLIAFWGRLLSGLESRRTRRKIAQPEIEAREELAHRLGEAARRMRAEFPDEFEAELQTRRTPEAAWMRERLGQDEVPSAD